MGKQRQSLQTHHLYLGVGGMLSVAALVLALTFGLSSAQMGSCTSPMYWDPATSSCRSPDAGTYIDPSASCTSAGGTWQGMSATPPCLMPGTTTTNTNTNTTTTTDFSADCARAGGTWQGSSATPPCLMPAITTTRTCAAGEVPTATNPCQPATNTGGACPSGQFWNAITNSCQATAPTVGSCTTGQWWDAANSTCRASADTTMRTCAQGETPTATNPCQSATATVGSCTTGQWWDPGSSQCRSSTDTTMRACGPNETPTTNNPCTPSGGQTCTSPNTFCPATNSCSTPEACGAATRVCGPGETPTAANPCKPATATVGSCTSSQWWDAASSTCRSSTDTSMRSCGPNETPTTNNPCRPESGSQTNMTPCPAGQHRMPVDGSCMNDGGMQGQQWTQPEMLQCPDPYDPQGTRTMHMPKQERYWDPQTNTEVVNEMDCAKWAEKMRGQGTTGGPGPGYRPGMPGPFPGMPGRGGPQPGGPRDRGEEGRQEFTGPDCSREYWNPFCKAGLSTQTSLEELTEGIEFPGEEEVELQRSLRVEVRQLKFETVKDPSNPVECQQFSPGGPGGPFPLPFGGGGIGGSAGLFGGPGDMYGGEHRGSSEQPDPTFYFGQNAVLESSGESRRFRGPGGFPGGGMPVFNPRPRECDVVDAEQRLQELNFASGISCPASGGIQAIIDEVKPVFNDIRALDAATAIEDDVLDVKVRFLRATQLLPRLYGDSSGSRGLMGQLDSCRQVAFFQRDCSRAAEEFGNQAGSPEHNALLAFCNNPLAPEYLEKIVQPGEDVNTFLGSWSPPQSCFTEMPFPMPSSMGGVDEFGENSILGALEEEDDFEFEEDFEGPGGPMMGPPMGGPVCGFMEPPGGAYMPKLECMPPVARLGMVVMQGLMKDLVNKRCTAEQDNFAGFACKGFEEAPRHLAREGRMLPPTVKDRVNEIVAAGTAACAANNLEIASQKFEEMMRLVMPFMRRVSFVNQRDIVDDIQGRENLTNPERRRLQERIRELEVQNAALDQTVQGLTVAVIRLEEVLKTTKASVDQLTNNVARLRDNPETATIGRALAERFEGIMKLVNDLYNALPEGVVRTRSRTYIERIAAAISKGVSSTGVDTVKQSLDGLISTVGQLTDADEQVDAVKTTTEGIEAYLSSEDEAARQRTDGTRSHENIPMNHWVASFMQRAVSPELNLTTSENATIDIAQVATWNNAVVRIMRLAKAVDKDNKIGEFDTTDPAGVVLATEVRGVAPWARPFVAACQRLDVAACSGSQDFNTSITRAQLAGLARAVLVAVVGESIVPASAADVTAADLSATDPNRAGVQFMKSVNAMGGCTGPQDANFCGARFVTIGEDVVIAVNLHTYLESLNAAAAPPAVE